ncbi:hypothetical protein C9374_008630 [Naegleria lovaniensis]|uniref:Spermatogenesis-associated protein 4 n=1 Tax=Naegleria lovaniensis TaxID=51637 RepID=A0AA88GKV5_NAELO|nr:uncharacterized protein C9374_008630 [Naegleria lovaniensis]KAG2378008.1 hypothetical protein C9374_008630 [Naegleria lovaniensis]
MSVPREILKWMQSLDLSYSIKNMRRDFSNGFLVAEMISRYYPNEVEMHSFDVGVGVKAKLDNWQQLEKFFRKHAVNISRKVIDDLIACRPNSLNQVLEEVYSFLTDKTIKKAKPVRPPVIPNIPNFAKPTLSKSHKDDGRAVPSSFVSLKRNQIAQAKEPNTETKEDNYAIPSLEITRDSKSSSTNRSKSSHQSQRSHSHHSVVQQKGLTSGFNSVMEDLNDLAVSLVEESNEEWKDLFNLDRTNPMQSIVAKIDQLPIDFLESLFLAIKERVANYAEVMSFQPKEFWKFMNLFVPCMKEACQTHAFECVVSVLKAVGLELTSKDPDSSWDVFEDFGLQKCLEIVASQPTKREEVLNVIYSFCKSDIHSHRNTLLKIQEKCGQMDSSLIVHVMALLVKMESSLLTINAGSSGPVLSEEQIPLFELYMTVAVSGLSHPSPKVRASSLGIIHTLLSFDDVVFEKDEKSIPAIPTNSEEISSRNQPLLFVMQNLWSQSIEPQLNDSWWEVTAQLVVLGSKCLTEVGKLYMIDCIKEYEEASVQLLSTILHKELNSTLKHIVLSYISPHLKKYETHFSELYLDILFSLSEEERVSLLEQPSNHVELLQVGNSQHKFPIMSIPFSWDSLTVGKTLAKRTVQLDHLEIEHYDVLNACVSVAQIEVSEEEEEKVFKDTLPSEWLTIYDQLQNHFYVGLVDEELCEMASQLLVKFCSVLRKEVVKTMIPHVIKTIEILFANNQMEHQQEVMSQFLIGLYGLGSPFSQPLLKLANSLMEQSQLAQNPRLSYFFAFIRQLQQL